MESLFNINKRLVDRFGSDLLGNPNYRVSWSNDQFEHRYGNFPIGNTGIINATKETRLVPKYFFKDRFVLEKKCELPYTNELPDASMKGFSYEPIFVFQDKNGNSLPLVWRPIEIMIWCAIRGPENVFTSRTEAASEEEITAKDVAYFENVLEDQSSYFGSMMNNKEAVQFNPDKQFTGEKVENAD